MNLTVTSLTLINEYDIDSLIMKDEIFGYCLYLNTLVMQIYIYRFKIWKTIVFIRFTENKIFAEKIIQNYSFGGGV
jgi:aldehyde dehydrogenase (NAD+)